MEHFLRMHGLIRINGILLNNCLSVCLSGRFTQKPPLPWLAMTTSIGTLVIALLVGYIFNATVNRIAKVEDDYRQMMELKKRTEMADIAKSQACPQEFITFSLYPTRLARLAVSGYCFA